MPPPVAIIPLAMPFAVRATPLIGAIMAATLAASVLSVLVALPIALPERMAMPRASFVPRLSPRPPPSLACRPWRGMRQKCFAKIKPFAYPFRRLWSRRMRGAGAGRLTSLWPLGRRSWPLLAFGRRRVGAG